MKRIILRGAFLLLGAGFLINTTAQTKTWTLEECIDYALENNIQIQQSDLNRKIADQNVIASKYNALPNLNASASHRYNFGQTIDPFTNQFANTQVRSNAFSISSGFTIFNGFRNINTIKRNQAQSEAARYDLDKLKNDISLNIANAYLAILFNQEVLKNAEAQLKVTNEQVDRIAKQVAAGVLADGASKEVEAQYASEELSKVNALNQLKLSKLNLAQLLRLENAEGFEIVSPNLDNFKSVSELITPGALYLTALEIMPEIKSAEYGLYTAEKGTQLARANYYPTLTVGGSIGSGFSGANRRLNSEGFLEQVPFTDQIDQNENKSIGFSLSIPLFNGLSARTSVKQAKIQQQIADLNLENTKLVLRQNIESAHNDAVAALLRYRAAEKSVAALRTSFSYTRDRFNVGLINSFDFNTEKNRLINAESELLQAKYNYIFSTKVLDFYQGNTVSFNKK